MTIVILKLKKIKTIEAKTLHMWGYSAEQNICEKIVIFTEDNK